MAPPQSGPDTFPRMLETVPQTERIVQCFGWLYGYFGVLAIAASVGAVLGGLWQEFSDQVQVLGLLVGMALAGPVWLWWEFRRRALRTVLVPRGGVIGIYRRGEFAQVMGREELKIRQLNRWSTIRAAILLPLIVMFFLAMPLIDRSYWPLSVVGVLLLIGCISGARTRLKLQHCIIPGAKYEQDMMLDKADMRRLLGI